MRLSLIFLLLVLAPALNAAPLDWKKLQGKYDYLECQSEGETVWPPKREDFYVWIFQPADKPWENTLYVMLLRRENSPMALSHNLHGINEGVYKDKNPHTGLIDGYQENFTDENGLHGTANWDYLLSSGSRVWGRSAIELNLSADGNTLSYEMMVAHRDQPERRERCRLKRQALELH